MLQAFIHRVLLRRHFWRYASFSEIAELYASRTMRIFALRMIAVFTSIYLLQQGYDLTFLAFFWCIFFSYKVLISWPATLVVARIGPKHGTFVSNILAAISMLLLPFIPSFGLWALAGWCIFQAASTCLYDICYLVDFSKVKNMHHAGKEIGYMNMLEKVASGLGPIIGGFIAFLAGPQIVMIISSMLFLIAAMPLFKTGEPVRTHQKLDFKGFPWRAVWRSLHSEMAVGFDLFATGTAWVLYMALVIFTGDGDELYAKLGVLASVTIVAALVSSYSFGRLIDHRRGGELLRISTAINSLIHIMRAFVTTPLGAVGANIANEAATTGYSMAFTRGVFDTADLSGKRIAYLFLIEVALNAGAAFAALVLGVLVILTNDQHGLQLFFLAAAGFTLFIATPKFVLYRR